MPRKAETRGLVAIRIEPCSGQAHGSWLLLLNATGTLEAALGGTHLQSYCYTDLPPDNALQMRSSTESEHASCEALDCDRERGMHRVLPPEWKKLGRVTYIHTMWECSTAIVVLINDSS